MTTRPRALPHPRPNVRKVPLDPYEQEMRNCPPIPDAPDGISLKAWLWGLGIVLPLWGLLGWWVFR